MRYDRQHGQAQESFGFIDGFDGGVEEIQREHKQDQAFVIYRDLAKKYPTHWITYAGEARLSVGSGNYDEALKQMKLCLANAPDNQKQGVQSLIKRLEDKQDINK